MDRFMGYLVAGAVCAAFAVRTVDRLFDGYTSSAVAKFYDEKTRFGGTCADLNGDGSIDLCIGGIVRYAENSGKYILEESKSHVYVADHFRAAAIVCATIQTSDRIISRCSITRRLPPKDVVTANRFYKEKKTLKKK